MLRLRLFTLAVALLMALSACTGAPATQALSVQSTSPTPGVPPTQVVPTATPTEGPTPTGAYIQLSPDAGGPGTPVQISGYLPGGPTQSDAQKDQSLLTANLCWDGCLSGLVMQSQSITWSATEAGHFQAQITVPAIPWLGANGPHALTSGDYTIGIQCLEAQIKGCATQEATVEATFHLQAPASGKCQGNAPCGSLSFNPSQASPSTTVQVSGWAPLPGIIDQQVFGYNLVLTRSGQSGTPLTLGQVQQALDGSLSGSFQVPQWDPQQGALPAGSYSVALQAIRMVGSSLLVAATPFEIISAPGWGMLNLSKPLWVQPAANLMGPSLAVDPSNPTHMAYCGPGVIQVTHDSGRTWTSVPTTAVAAAADSGVYTLGPGDSSTKAQCLSVTLDAAHPQSYFAVFETMNKDYGAPPTYFTGFATADNGQSWQVVPAPSADLAQSFGGFWSDGTGVQALFAGTSGGPDQAPQVSVEESSDGGATWSPGALTCPQSGPCLRWGPAPGSIGGMGSPLPQFVLASSDGGKTWSSPVSPVELRSAGPKELVAFAEDLVVLLDGGGNYPVLLSTQDAGKTWHAADLPTLPGWQNYGGAPFPGLQILPDGSLLALSDEANSSWRMYPAGSNSGWCGVKGATLPGSPTLLQVVGEQVWWFSPDTQKLTSTPLSSIRCG